MRYIPHTESDIQEMLDSIGVKSIDELFADSIDQSMRINLSEIDLPESSEPMNEQTLLKYFDELTSLNKTTENLISFLGSGAYNHYIPSVVNHIISRGEFLTSYTPYQAQLSQGTLQSIFEFQTMVSELLGMDVANASMYDGATSMVEAVLLAMRVTRRPCAIFSGAIHPEYLDVAKTYLGRNEKTFKVIPFCEKRGITISGSLDNFLDGSVACVVIQNPNFFGCIEDVENITERIHANGSLCVITFTEALAFGLIEPPGNTGADIAAGEGQSLGIPLSFGGPYLGLFSVKKDFLKSIPGRLVGLATDEKGRVGYTLTLQAREQHIRRERATSNICTNQGLCALITTIYLSLLGPDGLRKLALYNHAICEKLKKSLSEISGCEISFSSPTFNEFVLRTKIKTKEILSRLKEKNIVGGLPLSRFFPERENELIITVTEKNSNADLNKLIDGIKMVLSQ